MLADARAIFLKDMQIERRSKVLANQVVPFAGVILILFAFAFDKYPALLRELSPGLFWIATLFSLMMALQRSIAVESENQARDGLLLYGLEPAGIFLGKVAAVAVQSLILEVILFGGIIILYGAGFGGILLLAGSAILATLGISAVGVVFGAMVSSRSKDTLLPMLILPVVSPVLLSATKAWEDGQVSKVALGDPWLGLLAVFAVLYLALGITAFGAVLED